MVLADELPACLADRELQAELGDVLRTDWTQRQIRAALARLGEADVDVDGARWVMFRSGPESWASLRGREGLVLLASDGAVLSFIPTVLS